MTLYFLPLEPIDMRYTKQWYSWFAEVFNSYGLDWQYIEGNCREQIPATGSWLDFEHTWEWKFAQLHRLFAKPLAEHDWIFLPDGEFPGIEAVEYWRRLAGKKVNVAAYWHAGTYDPWDLTSQRGLGKVGKKLEEVWFEITDLIFVATSYHRDLIIEQREVEAGKVKVVGGLIDVEGLQAYRSPQRWGMVFTGRLSVEKGIETIQELERDYHISIYKTQANKLAKDDYYRKVASFTHVIAPSLQETFGIGVAEGMALGLTPIVPNGLSFTDYVPAGYRYNNIEEILDIYKKRADLKQCVERYQYQHVIGEMLRWCRYT